jgi:hypothetical protein
MERDVQELSGLFQQVNELTAQQGLVVQKWNEKTSQVEEETRAASQNLEVATEDAREARSFRRKGKRHNDSLGRFADTAVSLFHWCYHHCCYYHCCCSCCYQGLILRQY